MNKRLMAVTVGVGSFLLLTGFGPFGCGGTPEERFNRAQSTIEGRIESKLEDLDATAAQQAKIKEIEQRIFSEAKPLVLSHRQMKTDIASELRSETPDAAKLHALVDARAAAYQAFAHKMVDAAVEAHGVLTPAQRAQLNAEFADRMQE